MILKNKKKCFFFFKQSALFSGLQGPPPSFLNVFYNHSMMSAAHCGSVRLLRWPFLGSRLPLCQQDRAPRGASTASRAFQSQKCHLKKEKMKGWHHRTHPDSSSLMQLLHDCNFSDSRFFVFFLSSNFTKWRLCVCFFFRDTFVFGASFCLIHDGTSGDFFSNARSVLSALKRSSGEATCSS